MRTLVRRTLNGAFAGLSALITLLLILPMATVPKTSAWFLSVQTAAQSGSRGPQPAALLNGVLSRPQIGRAGGTAPLRQSKSGNEGEGEGESKSEKEGTAAWRYLYGAWGACLDKSNSTCLDVSAPADAARLSSQAAWRALRPALMWHMPSAVLFFVASLAASAGFSRGSWGRGRGRGQGRVDERPAGQGKAGTWAVLGPLLVGWVLGPIASMAVDLAGWRDQDLRARVGGEAGEVRTSAVFWLYVRLRLSYLRPAPSYQLTPPSIYPGGAVRVAADLGKRSSAAAALSVPWLALGLVLWRHTVGLARDEDRDAEESTGGKSRGRWRWRCWRGRSRAEREPEPVPHRKGPVKVAADTARWFFNPWSGSRTAAASEKGDGD